MPVSQDAHHAFVGGVRRHHRWRQQDVFCQRDRCADDSLRLSAGGSPVRARKGTEEAPIKQTHLDAKPAYMQRAFSCRISM